MVSFDKEAPLNFGIHPHLDLDLDIFQGFFGTARRDIFPQFGSRLLKTDKIFVKIFTRDIFVDEEFTTKCLK